MIPLIRHYYLPLFIFLEEFCLPQRHCPQHCSVGGRLAASETTMALARMGCLMSRGHTPGIGSMLLLAGSHNPISAKAYKWSLPKLSAAAGQQQALGVELVISTFFLSLVKSSVKFVQFLLFLTALRLVSQFRQIASESCLPSISMTTMSDQPLQ